MTIQIHRKQQSIQKPSVDRERQNLQNILVLIWILCVRCLTLRYSVPFLSPQVTLGVFDTSLHELSRRHTIDCTDLLQDYYGLALDIDNFLPHCTFWHFDLIYFHMSDLHHHYFTLTRWHKGIKCFFFSSSTVMAYSFNMNKTNWDKRLTGPTWVLTVNDCRCQCAGFSPIWKTQPTYRTVCVNYEAGCFSWSN